MDLLLGGVISRLFAAILTSLADLPAIWTLAPISVLAGLGMLWVFARTSNQFAIRALKKRRSAFLLEIRLFGDEPSLIWRAQGALLVANVRYIGLMLWPVLVMTGPMILLFVQLEAFYGRAPLRVGESALVTMQLHQPLADSAKAPMLEAPDGIAIETPAVRITSERQVSWRVRASKQTAGLLRLRLGDVTLEKSIEAGAAPRYLTSRRASALADFFWEPGESRLAQGPVDWMEVAYPAAGVAGLGLELHWLWWFLILSMASALLLKGWFKVAF